MGAAPKRSKTFFRTAAVSVNLTVTGAVITSERLGSWSPFARLKHNSRFADAKEAEMASIYRVFIVFALFALTAMANAGTPAIRPMETLKGPIDQIISLLNDTSYEGREKRDAQREKIWKIARPVFDFNEISRRAVGKPWTKFSAQEKARFSAVFSEFIGTTYTNRLQGEYSNERIDFDKELVKGSKALVRTRLSRKNIVIPIDYRMHQVDGTWRIYDILLDNGVSFVKNYRVQFTSILKNGTPAQLIERLEQKLAN
jgi:phospholipid transport system substrate-binding protein